jgi:hypothetical protein
VKVSSYQGVIPVITKLLRSCKTPVWQDETKAPDTAIDALLPSNNNNTVKYKTFRRIDSRLLKMLANH